MIIQLHENISKTDKEILLKSVFEIGYKPSEVTTQVGKYIVCSGSKEFDLRSIGNLSGVKDVHRVTSEYKLVSRKWKVKDTEIDLGDGVKIQRNNLTIMAGPCAVESEEHAENVIEHLVKNNINVMRVMVFKPRSSPYSFRGIGLNGLKNISSGCKTKRIKIISEVMEVAQVEEMADHVDIFQIGARNTQNFNLLEAVGKINKPVLIKRGMSGTIDELLHSAEYIFATGNEKIMLCERGIRTFEKAYRNTLDLNAVPILKEKTHLPIIVDPSHGIGIRMYVEQMALAAILAGADGIIAEVHEKPEKALSDGQQTLNYREAENFYYNIRKAIDFRGTLRSMA